MNLLFLQKDVFAKPAIMSLSAVLENAGHQCDLLVEDLEDDFIQGALDIEPDIIAFSITTGEYLWMRKIGNEIRKRYRKKIICGGPHPTFYPDVINEEFLDAICIGEGEEAILDFVNSCGSEKRISKIKNFIVKDNDKIVKSDVRTLIEDLDSLPFYNRKIYQKYKVFTNPENSILYQNVVLTSRGCPYKCTFCFNKLYNEIYKGKGKIYRRRTVDNIITELNEMKERVKNIKFITFDDDIFSFKPGEWLVDFLEKYRLEINIPFKLNTRANLLDEKIIKKLKAAGCYSIKIGVESGNEDIRNIILGKGITENNIINAASLMKKYGIKFQTFNMLGNPGETLDIAFETYELNRKIKPDFVWCSFLNPYPGTDIFKYAMENDYLENNFSLNSFSYSYFTGAPIKITNKKELYNLQRLLFFGVIFNLPRRVMKFLIKLPLSILYKLIFGISMVVGLKRINKLSVYYSFKLSILHLIKYNF